MIGSWVLFPLVLAALGLGWGALVERATGGESLGVYGIPVGIAAVIVVAAILTSFSATAPAAAPVAAAGGLVGLAFSGRRRYVPAPAIAAAVGVLLIYGAPVILSGQATFLGYVRLDDTATWLALADNLFAHGRSVAALPPSTFQLLVSTNLSGSAYPAGAFMILGVGHWITGIDSAWLFQPYMASCAAALSLALYGLVMPLLESRWLRAFVVFIGAQSALLIGYAAWGGIKELTAAFLLVLGVALMARLLESAAPRPRGAIPLAVAGAALIVTLGPGSAVYELPALLLVLVVIVVRLRWPVGVTARTVGAAIVATGVLAIPVWLSVAHYFAGGLGGFLSSHSDSATNLGNLLYPLDGLQIAGVWLRDDFRYSLGGTSGETLTWILIGVVLASGALGVALAVKRRRHGIVLYVAVALAGYGVLALAGSTPWLIGKTLAISSPAILAAGMAGGAMLLGSKRRSAVAVGVIAVGAITGGVLWSNFLQYRNVTLAPRARLADLAHVGNMLGGKTPTFFNEYEIYGTRHFLWKGAPVSPAEYRPVNLPTLGNAILTKVAWANIDSFGLTTLAPYRSLVLRVNPTESLPPSIYKPVYLGRYYQLWQQPTHPTLRVLNHYPLGDSTNDAYCGTAEFGAPYSPLCPIAPAAVPQCSQVMALGRTASADHAQLLAYERVNPIVVRATQTTWGNGWASDATSGTLVPTAADATAVAHVNVPYGVRGWQLWLGGSFDRGFSVTVDGRRIGSVSNELNSIAAYDRVGVPITLGPGVHTIAVTYGSETLAPGSADAEEYTSLTAIVLSPPLYPSTVAAQMLHVAPRNARSLCGRSLDWIEVVAPT